MALDSGEKINQETRGWDENKQSTFSQRKKESSHDYRYFPEPDLPKLKISELSEFDDLKKSLPELPWSRRERYISDEVGITKEAADLLVYEKNLGDLFDSVIEIIGDNKELIKLASNYITSDLVGIHKDHKGDLENVSAKQFASLVQMIDEGEISSRGAKDILQILYTSGGEPRNIAKEKNLIQKSDEGELKILAKKIIEDNPSVVEEFKGGKESALQFLIGQGMRATNGSANPKLLKEIFEKLLR